MSIDGTIVVDTIREGRWRNGECGDPFERSVQPQRWSWDTVFIATGARAAERPLPTTDRQLVAGGRPRPATASHGCTPAKRCSGRCF